MSSDAVFLATGAYGRRAEREDWLAGKDFRAVNGPYFSIRDCAKIKADGYEEIHFYIIDAANRNGTLKFKVTL